MEIHMGYTRPSERGSEEYHHLVQELRLNNGRFKVYFRMNLGQFDNLLSIIGASITKMTTNYRESIGPAARLSIFAVGKLRFGATGGPAMVGFLPTQLLVKHFNQAPSNSLLTCHYQGLTTEVPSHMCLLLIRLCHYRETSCPPRRERLRERLSMAGC
ncbi:hypothetical protein DPX16_1887 [Anabarilius grahami]|uniref:Uncharacterized protein n=1 Tax=Anabarilius grahami TaxID=495550 RepID=A0A3N0YRV8_ANAGA|nr:hypothetical protein DPX16_1887 [Anabarilius grahami]